MVLSCTWTSAVITILHGSARRLGVGKLIVALGRIVTPIPLRARDAVSPPHSFGLRRRRVRLIDRRRRRLPAGAGTPVSLSIRATRHNHLGLSRRRLLQRA